MAILLPALLALPQLTRSQTPARLHNLNVPLFFMQPPEIPLGVSGHPFHAMVTADWKLPMPGGKMLATEVKGNVWRDAAGDVRIEGARTLNGGAPAPFPKFYVLFEADGETMLRWNSDTTNVTSFRSATLNSSNHFFEGLAVPEVFGLSRSNEYNCRMVADTCVSEPLADRVIESIRVTGTRYKETIPAATVGAPKDLIVTRDVWTDPALNVIVEIDGADPVFGNFTMRLSGISPGNLDKDLFEIPKGYKVGDITPPSRLPALH